MVTYTSKQDSQYCYTSWIILEHNNKIKASKAKQCITKHTGREHGNLLSLHRALVYLEKSFQYFNSCPKSQQLIICTPSRKATSLIYNIKYDSPTIFKYSKNEASLTYNIKYQLLIHNKYETIDIENRIYQSNQYDQIRETLELDNNTDTYELQTENIIHIDLTINNLSITGDILTSIWNEATREQYIQYLGTKYDWKQKIVININWEAISYATNNKHKHMVFFQKNDKRVAPYKRPSRLQLHGEALKNMPSV
jgi:hypothetical protein